jgi:hypothetical protein
MVSDLTLRAVGQKNMQCIIKEKMYAVSSKYAYTYKRLETVKCFLIPVNGSRLFSVLILCVFLQVSYSKLLVFGLVACWAHGELIRWFVLNSKLQLSF